MTSLKHLKGAINLNKKENIVCYIVLSENEVRNETFNVIAIARECIEA